jgi:mono/diheme cytochrome c family protein
MNSLFKAFILFIVVLTFINCSNKSSDSSAQTESPPEEVAVNKDKETENLYLRYCMACHQTDGTGIPGMYPPLINSPTVNSSNKADFINVLLNGLKGPIVIHGKIYDQTMPSQDFLSDEDLASIINYVGKSFKNNGHKVTHDEIRALRKK